MSQAPDDRTPIGDALKRIDKLPRNQAELSVEAREGEVGATVNGRADFGKGVSGGVSAGWFSASGWFAAAKVWWRGGKNDK